MILVIALSIYLVKGMAELRGAIVASRGGRKSSGIVTIDGMYDRGDAGRQLPEAKDRQDVRRGPPHHGARKQMQVA